MSLTGVFEGTKNGKVVVRAKSAADDIDISAIIAKCEEIKGKIDETSTNEYNRLYNLRDSIGQDFLFGEIDFDSMLVDLYTEYKQLCDVLKEEMDAIKEGAYAAYNKLQERYNSEAEAKFNAMKGD